MLGVSYWALIAEFVPDGVGVSHVIGVEDVVIGSPVPVFGSLDLLRGYVPLRLSLILGKQYRHRAGATHLPAGPCNRVRVFEPEARDSLEPLLDRDSHLHAGEVRASAAV